MPRVTGALVVANAPAALTVVAGLPLAVRAVLALQAVGIPTVAVFAGPQQRRLAPLVAARCPDVPCLGTVEDAAALAWPTPVLAVGGDVLFDEATLEPLIEDAAADTIHAGQFSGGGEVAPALTVPAGLVPVLLTEATRTLGLRAETVRRLGAVTPRPLAPGLFAPAGRAGTSAALETALFDHLARRTVGKDSYLAALIDRRLSRPVTALLLPWPITPSHVTLTSLVFGLAGAAGLATVSDAGRIAGVLALIVSIVLDCVDGEIARARFQQSATGARLDVIGDYLVNLAVFVGLGIGLARQGLPPGGGWAVAALIAGVAASMVVMHGLFVRPALAQGDLHAVGGDLQATAVAAVVEKLASRDYTYLLLVLALLGHLEWFLYAAAVGSWAFVAGVLGYWVYQRRVLARRVVQSA
jgi:phosphatidylglycerophosphate synthase